MLWFIKPIWFEGVYILTLVYWWIKRIFAIYCMVVANIHSFAAGCYGRVLDMTKNSLDSVKSDWGYVTVREHAHMFWWLFFQDPTYQPSFLPPTDPIPVVVWLQVSLVQCLMDFIQHFYFKNFNEQQWCLFFSWALCKLLYCRTSVICLGYPGF